MGNWHGQKQGVGVYHSLQNGCLFREIILECQSTQTTKDRQLKMKAISHEMIYCFNDYHWKCSAADFILFIYLFIYFKFKSNNAWFYTVMEVHTPKHFWWGGRGGGQGIWQARV